MITARAALLLTTALAACTTERVSIGSVTATRPLTDGIAVIAARNERGAVRFERGIPGEITIVAEIRVKESRSDEFPSPLRFDDHVRTTSADDILEVQSAHAGRVDEDDWAFDFVIRVPDGLALRAQLDAGTVAARVGRIAGFEAAVDAGNVDFVAEAVTGATNIRIDAGQLRLEVNEAVADLDFDIDAGRASLRLPSGPSYAFDLDVTAGSISVASRIAAVKPQRSYARSTLQAAGDGPKIRGRVDAGQITIE